MSQKGPVTLTIITGEGITVYPSVACESTISGWLWYCNTCDSHGNADSEDEVRFVAAAHVTFQDSLGGPDDCEIQTTQL